MDRLTKYVDDKYIRIKGTKSLYSAQEREGAPASNAIVRLAAYEDTGMMPEEMKWISVKEKLPENDMKVLCRYGFEKDGKTSEMMFTGCLDYYATDPEPHFQHASTCLVVTHWMPLPAPPEEG